MNNDTPIRLGLLVDEKWYAGLMAGLGRLLKEHGPVEPTLIMCRESAPDPDEGLPFVRLREEAGGAPSREYDWDDITGYERFLANRDTYYENRWDRVARSLCAETERLFDAQPFDCLLVWSGTRLSLRAAVAVARARGIAVVTLETPYFQQLPEPPETDFALTLNRMTNKVLIWDTVRAPQCGPSQMTREWRQAQTRPGLQAFFDRLHAERVAKFSQEDIKRFLTGKVDATVDATDQPDPEVELFVPPDTRVLLVLGQVSNDSARYFEKHLIDDWPELGRAIAQRLPPGWILWFKGHPLDRRYQQDVASFAHELHAIDPRCRVLPTTIDIHACYQRCNAVACVNSTATIEAATYRLPVLNFGRGAFTHVGMSTVVENLDTLGALIAGLPDRMTDEQIRARDHYLSYILYDYLIPVGSPKRMLARIRQAIGATAAA